jgi:tRNA (guanine6-N2)-methyltransferase
MMAQHKFYVTSFKGVGILTLRELKSRLDIEKSAIETGIVRDYDIARFSRDLSGDQAEELGTLRTTEDVFYELGTVRLTGERTDEALVEELMRVAPIEQAVSCKRALTPKARPGAPTFRVIVQAEDAEWRHYRRERLEEAAAVGIGRRYRKWRRVDDDSAIEVWVQVIDQTALIGLLSKPTDGDIFLDPNCGAGTILMERALDRPYERLLGGDINPEAVAATRENFGKRHKPWTFDKWDAASLPLEDGSVNRVVTNPPWGRQISAGDNLPAYYKQFIKEIVRVLVPWGRAVILTSERRAMREALAAHPALKIDEQIKGIMVMGRKADLFCLIRTDT